MTFETDLEKAQAVVEQWEAKAAAARAEAAEVDATAGALILDDPSAAERVTLQVQAKEREARAYDTAAAEAKRRVTEVYRTHVTAEARALAKQAAAKWREAEKHEAKVGGLLEQLLKLDGAEYVPVRGEPARLDGEVYRPAVDGPLQTRLDELESEAEFLEEQAAVAQQFVETGSVENAGWTHVRVPLPPVLAKVKEAGVSFA